MNPTLLGSRVWDDNHTDDGSGTPYLGESRTADHRWDSGALPVAIPTNQTVGKSSCIAQGELLANGLQPADRTEGFPTACFVPTDVPNPDYVFGFQVWYCPTQAFWARCLYLLSNGLLAECGSFLSQRFSGASVTVVAKSTAYPPYAIVVHPAYCCAAMGGTTNLQQALVQAIELFQGPVDYGKFSTGKLWYDFASVILNALSTAGVNDGRPLCVAGHSYGGCSAMLVAARAVLGIPGREIRYITFGAPKPGDSRLASLLRDRFDGLSLVNDTDLVAALPPSTDVIAAMVRLLPTRSYLGWTQWVYPPESCLLRGTALLKNVVQTPDSYALAGYIGNVWATGQIGALAVHEMSAYLAAILGRCPEFFPTDIGQVLGLVVQTEPDLGQVLGLPGPANVNSPCCDDIPFYLLMTCVSATDAYSRWVGLTSPLASVGDSLNWQGVWPANGDPDAFAVDLLCNNDILGFFWSLGDLGSVLGGGTAPSSCVPFLIDSTWNNPLGDGEMVFAITADGVIPMPTGTVIAFAGGSPPVGYLACDGSAVSRATYANLFAVIGTTFGPGDGSTTFNLPDLRDRSVLGVSPGGLGVDRPTARAIADVGGEESHTLVIAEQPAHTHVVTDPGHVHASPDGAKFITGKITVNAQSGTGVIIAEGAVTDTASALTGVTNQNTGGGGAHNTLHPFLVLPWCIAF